MKNYFKPYYLLLLLATVLFACSDSDVVDPIIDPEPGGELVTHAEIIGVYTVVASDGGVVGETWTISESVIAIGSSSAESYLYSKNALVTLSTTYNVYKKDGTYLFTYRKNGVTHTATLSKKGGQNVVELSQLLGVYKITDALIDNVKDEIAIGSLWTIADKTVRINCGEATSFTYLPNILTIGSTKYEVNMAGQVLTIKYKEAGKSYVLTLASTTEKCDAAIEQKDIVGTFKVAKSTSTQAVVGDFFTITENSIQMGCNASLFAYTFSAQNASLKVGTAVYKLSKVANALNLVFLEGGKPVAISLESTTENCSLNKASIIKLMEKVADWQIDNYTYPAQGDRNGGMLDFTSGTLFVGMHEFANSGLSSKTTYSDWLKNEIGETRTKWKVSTTLSGGYGVFHADDLAIAQFYLASHIQYKAANMLANTKTRLDAIITQGPSEVMDYTKNKQSWTWCDALFMAPPAYAQAYEITKDVKYLNFMKRQFKLCTDHLYDTTEKLYYRDITYIYPKKVEANGKKVFWGRGNGWVVAGIANMLKYLPADYSERKYYETILVDMIDKLLESQDEKGFWHASLLDMGTYKSPETSASTLITYAIAYGINNGLLEKDKYMPSLVKAWSALETAVHPNGKLGWVQPIGQDPKEVTYDMTAVYGVGGFLLAGTEIARVLEK